MKMKIIKNKKQNGFSLLETLIYVAIFSVFIVAVASFVNNLTSSRLHNQIIFEVNDQGAKVMKMITQTLRNGSNVNTPTVGNTTSNLNISTYTESTSPTIFSENSGVLYMTEGGGSPVALTNNKVIISNLLFSNLSRSSTPNNIKISFTLTSINSDPNLGGTYSFNFNSSASLRK